MSHDPVDDDLLRALGGEILRMSSRRSTAYDGSWLETSAFRILWLLAESGPRTLREISGDLQLERSTVNRQVNAAIHGGHLERLGTQGPDSLLVRPTARGHEAYQHDARLRALVYQQALDELGRERATFLVDGLRAFNDSLDGVHARERSAEA